VPPSQKETRLWIARGFSFVEDLVYVTLGVLLAVAAIVLLGSAVADFGRTVMTSNAMSHTVIALDRILLVLLVVELLYTVQVSLREHAQTPEPFLLVGLIAAIRRVLVVTAEFGEPGAKSDVMVNHFVLELSVLTALIVALALSLFVLRKAGKAIAIPSHRE
jgi:uncharacterized membrane protein (DUF373 family)